MSSLSCLILDDEELARKLIRNYIDRLPFLELVDECEDPLKAYEIIQDNRIDLIFLDIQMPGMTGLDFLRSLSHPPLVILTTAYKEHAIEGFELDVVDYLLKPFSFERFAMAVNKAMERKKGHGEEQHSSDVGPTHKPFLSVKSSHKIHRIYLEDIVFIESMREYVAFHTNHGRILSLGSMKSLENELPIDQFIRIHKSYIVPLRKVEAIEGNLIHIGDKKLPIGRSYADKVKESLI